MCQAGGWGLLGLVYIFFHITLSQKADPYFFPNLLLFLTEGVFFSHLMRLAIKGGKLLKLPMTKQIPALFITVLAMAFFFSAVDIMFTKLLRLDENMAMKGESILNQIVRNWFGTTLFLTIWALIYFTYHYVMMSRNDQLDKIKLESLLKEMQLKTVNDQLDKSKLENLLKEMQLKTIKSHINPHFIFNALNSIRALVDENPTRARTAITELSNILRSSLQAEKVEVTPMARELALIKDYLELEHIRFEDRLQVKYCIDEDTLDMPVPPMMLQTLVENAIKHGISKQVDGGLIHVTSMADDHYHILTVQNTGHLTNSNNPDGFGLESTRSRLRILYSDKARFDIKNVENNLVEVKVCIPLSADYAVL